MVEQAAIDAVTSVENLSSFGNPGAQFRVVHDANAVAQLSDGEGLDAAEARRLARQAVIDVGGYVEPIASRGPCSGRLSRRVNELRECWRIPVAAVTDADPPRISPA